MRWNTGGSVNTTSYRELESFLVDGVVTDRALQDGIACPAGAEEIQFWFDKTYAVDIAGVSRFLIPTRVKFLKDQTVLFSLLDEGDGGHALCGPPSSRMPRMGSLALSES